MSDEFSGVPVSPDFGVQASVKPEQTTSRIDRLVQIAVLRALHDSLPRKRRRQLVRQLRLIADRWEHPTKVIRLRAKRPKRIQPELQAAARRLRRAAELLDAEAEMPDS